jgi:hypothetical protein
VGGFAFRRAGVGQSANGQGFWSLWKLPKRPICARYWLRLSPKFIRLALGAP